MNDEKKSFFAGAGAIDSMRYNGYKNAAMALGELVDNSLQENANEVRIIAEVEQKSVNKNKTQSICRIAVIDNGNGMDDDKLESCLRVGYGTRRGVKGMGKYGVGLPFASISQCQVTEVWSWQNGIENAKYTKLNITVDDWFQRGMFMPKPDKKPIPDPWKKFIDEDSEHGTVVVWSLLDLLKWKTSGALHRNSEFLIGRMYRHWINSGKAKIIFTIYDRDSEEIIEHPLRAVDPMYLMKNTSVSDIAPEDPMFELVKEEKFHLMVDGKLQPIIIRGSVAKKSIRERKIDGRDAGLEPHGKHAAKNVGLSIVRENRELMLDAGWAHTESQVGKPINRWWGMEIEFGNELDATFGVENNKQRANSLTEVSFKEFKDYIENDEDDSAVRKRLEKEDIGLYNCLYTAERLRKLNAYIIGKVPPTSNSSKEEAEGKKRRVVEVVATQATKDRIKEGHIAGSDTPEKSREEILVGVKASLEESGYGPEEINDICEEIIDGGYDYVFRKKKIDTDAFFSVDTEGGTYIISLNMEHPLYERIFGLFDAVEGSKEKTPDEKQTIIIDAYDSIKLMFASWARMEDEATDSRKSNIQSNRRTWGSMVTNFAGKEFDNE